MKNKYSRFSREQLEAKLEKLERERYGLVWEDKEEDVAKQCEIELPVLTEDIGREIVCDTDLPYNYIIEGDNYHSLYTLNFTHRKKIDVIYIDPPYNTGNKSWKYNNDFVEREDKYRHSKWISFMNKRLRIAKQLLKDNGVLVLTIDDYELFSVGLLLDNIFGEQNRIGIIAIETNPRGRTTNNFFATSHEYILFYAKNINNAQVFNLPLTQEQKEVFKFEDQTSHYRLLPFRRSGGLSTPNERPNSEFSLYFSYKQNNIIAVGGKRKFAYPKKYVPECILMLDKKQNIVEYAAKDFFSKYKDIIEILPIDTSGQRRVWRWSEREKILKYARDGYFNVVIENDKYTVQLKDRIKEGRKAKTIWVDPKYDASSNGTVLIEKILERSKMFDYPKSLYATLDALRVLLLNKPNAIVLDFFAGSGTTGHAVLELNKEDGGNRQFILCTNNENNICEEVTYPRIEKVIEGYADKAGIPANVKYFKQTFVPNIANDQDKRELVNRSTELLCVAENTFEQVAKRTAKNDFAIFKSVAKQTAIIYDEEHVEKCVSKLNALNSSLKTVIYVFSYDHTHDEEDFKNLEIDFSVKPIPEAILNVYRKVTKMRKK